MEQPHRSHSGPKLTAYTRQPPLRLSREKSPDRIFFLPRPGRPAGCAAHRLPTAQRKRKTLACASCGLVRCQHGSPGRPRRLHPRYPPSRPAQESGRPVADRPHLSVTSPDPRRLRVSASPDLRTSASPRLRVSVSSGLPVSGHPVFRYPVIRYPVCGVAWRVLNAECLMLNVQCSMAEPDRGPDGWKLAAGSWRPRRVACRVAGVAC